MYDKAGAGLRKTGDKTQVYRHTWNDLESGKGCMGPSLQVKYSKIAVLYFG